MWRKWDVRKAHKYKSIFFFLNSPSFKTTWIIHGVRFVFIFRRRKTRKPPHDRAAFAKRIRHVEVEPLFLFEIILKKRKKKHFVESFKRWSLNSRRDFRFYKFFTLKKNFLKHTSLSYVGRMSTITSLIQSLEMTEPTFNI